MARGPTDGAPFGQRLLRLRNEVEARVRVMCPHPIGSRAEKAWVAWAKGVVFGCVVAQGGDAGPGGDLGTEVCLEKFRSSGPKRGGTPICRDPTDCHGSRGQMADMRQRFSEGGKWQGKGRGRDGKG